MSSKEFQVVKRNQRFNQMIPSQNINQKQLTIKKIDSTRTKSPVDIQTSQPASTFVSRRELSLNSLADARGQNQLPVRAKENDFGRVQNKKEDQLIQYEYRPNKREIKSRLREVSSVGKKDNQRYKSFEPQNVSKRRFDTSESPIKSRVQPIFGDSGNFSMKKWAYSSKEDINKIIILQRWWRYFLQKNNLIPKKSDNFLRNRSKSTDCPKKINFQNLIKAGENITEKILPGKNNKLIVETRKVEVFKLGKHKKDKTIMAESKETIDSSEKIEKYKKMSKSIDKDIKSKVLNDEKIKKKYDFSLPKSIGEFRFGSVEKIRQSYSSVDSKYGKLKKAGENITEKTFPGENNTLINEKRVVEVYKVNKPKPEEDLRVATKEEGKYSQSFKEKDKKGEKITESPFPAKDEVYKFDQSKSKQDLRTDKIEKGKYIDRTTDSQKKGDVKKKGEQIISTIYPRRNELINELKKIEVYQKTKSHEKNKRYLQD